MKPSKIKDALGLLGASKGTGDPKALQAKLNEELAKFA